MTGDRWQTVTDRWRLVSDMWQMTWFYFLHKRFSGSCVQDFFQQFACLSFILSDPYLIITTIPPLMVLNANFNDNNPGGACFLDPSQVARVPDCQQFVIWHLQLVFMETFVIFSVWSKTQHPFWFSIFCPHSHESNENEGNYFLGKWPNFTYFWKQILIGHITFFRAAHSLSGKYQKVRLILKVFIIEGT